MSEPERPFVDVSRWLDRRLVRAVEQNTWYELMLPTEEKRIQEQIQTDLDTLRNYPVRASELAQPYPIPYPVYRGSGSTGSLAWHLLRLWLWRLRMPRWLK